MPVNNELKRLLTTIVSQAEEYNNRKNKVNSAQSIYNDLPETKKDIKAFYAEKIGILGKKKIEQLEEMLVNMNNLVQSVKNGSITPDDRNALNNFVSNLENSLVKDNSNQAMFVKLDEIKGMLNAPAAANDSDAIQLVTKDDIKNFAVQAASLKQHVGKIKELEDKYTATLNPDTQILMNLLVSAMVQTQQGLLKKAASQSSQAQALNAESFMSSLALIEGTNADISTLNKFNVVDADAISSQLSGFFDRFQANVTQLLNTTPLTNDTIQVAKDAVNNASLLYSVAHNLFDSSQNGIFAKSIENAEDSLKKAELLVDSSLAAATIAPLGNVTDNNADVNALNLLIQQAEGINNNLTVITDFISNHPNPLNKVDQQMMSLLVSAQLSRVFNFKRQLADIRSKISEENANEQYIKVPVANLLASFNRMTTDIGGFQEYQLQQHKGLLGGVDNAAFQQIQSFGKEVAEIAQIVSSVDIANGPNNNDASEIMATMGVNMEAARVALGNATLLTTQFYPLFNTAQRVVIAQLNTSAKNHLEKIEETYNSANSLLGGVPAVAPGAAPALVPAAPALTPAAPALVPAAPAPAAPASASLPHAKLATHIMEVGNSMGYTDEKIGFKDILSSLPISPAERVSVAVSNPDSVAYFKGVALDPGSCIRATKCFGKDTEGNDRIGRIIQDHTGKVTLLSSKNLTLEDKQENALKSAKMALANYKNGDGDINVAGNSALGSMVYAALLFLKQSDPKLENVNINIKDCPGCKALSSPKHANAFIESQLGADFKTRFSGEKKDLETVMQIRSERIEEHRKNFTPEEINEPNNRRVAMSMLKEDEILESPKPTR